MASDLVPIDWARQFGGTAADFGESVAIDADGNVFVAGNSFITPDPITLPVDLDIFLSKFDRLGTLLWEKKIQSPESESNSSMALDRAGNLYMAGWVTLGTDRDAFVAKYDTDGNELWWRTFGTPSEDSAYDIAVDDAGDLVIGGSTSGSFGGLNAGNSDAFIAKLDGSGNLLWKQQIGTVGSDLTRSLTVDKFGNTYTAGHTTGPLGDTHAGYFDAYAAKFDSNGELLWTRQFGSPDSDAADDIAVDSKGNAYVVGSTQRALGGDFQGGLWDCFLAGIDGNGNLAWTQQVGTQTFDRINTIAVDANEDLLIGGFGFSGEPIASLGKFTNKGQLLWTEGLGLPHNGDVESIVVDSAGVPHLVGRTTESDWAPNAGGQDAFVIKLGIPEPSSLVLLAIGLAIVGIRRR